MTHLDDGSQSFNLFFSDLVEMIDHVFADWPHHSHCERLQNFVPAWQTKCLAMP